MDEIRPSDKELRFLGFSDLQVLLISDLPADIAWDAYRLQLEILMSDSDDEIDF